MSDPEATQPSLSVVLPAFNEGVVIEGTVRAVAAVLETLSTDFEIIVVNDGSLDRTGEVLGRLEGEPALRLRVMTHPTNQGYGAALATGLDAAGKDLLFVTDGDKQFDVRELGSFVQALDPGTDLVIGWRKQRADPPLRRLNAWGWKLLVNALFGYTARDVDCAFKLMRRRVWQSVTVRARGATFSAELLVKARRLGFVIKELPVRHLPRTAGRPTGARAGVIIRAFQELLHLWRNLDAELAVDRQAGQFQASRTAPG